MFHATRPANSLGARVVVLAIIGWGFAEIFGASGVSGVACGLCVLLIQERRQSDELGAWANQRRLAVAVRENRDPGPLFRGAVEMRARWLVAHHRGVVWGRAAFLGGIAAVFLGFALVRSNTSLLWLGGALLLCAPGLVLLQWRAVSLAALWLANVVEPAQTGIGPT
jgi:hypothetical protein